MKDNEMRGIGNSYDFGDRWQMPQIGRLGMSRDKLYRNFPGQSPYVYANNSPNAMTDKGGNHAEIVITKTGNAKSAQIAKVDVNVVYYTTLDREKRLSGDLNFYNRAQSDIRATYGADGNKVFTGKVGNTAYNATFNIDIKQPLQNEAELGKILRENPVANQLDFNANILGTSSRKGTSAGANTMNFDTRQRSSYPYPFAHEVSHNLGSQGDWDNKKGYMSNYSGDRNVQGEEVSELLTPAINLANEFEGQQVKIHFFSNTDEKGDINVKTGRYNTYKVFDESSGTYLKSVTTPQINPQPQKQ